MCPYGDFLSHPMDYILNSGFVAHMLTLCRIYLSVDLPEKTGVNWPFLDDDL